jgi:SAM-dependent methyltransferase
MNFDQISNNNQIERDIWVRNSIRKYFLNGTVLDVGSGTAPYKKDLQHLNYLAHDFGEYKGVKLGGDVSYASIDIKSDISDIPLKTGSLDYIICTEVLEHVPEPLLAFKEFSRLLKPNGTAIITAPFTSGLHQEPYHFYAGFSPYFFQYACAHFNFELINCESHGGFLRLMAQELGRLSNLYNYLNNIKYETKIESMPSKLEILANELINLEPMLNQLNQTLDFDKFSIGYWVIVRKTD